MKLALRLDLSLRSPFLVLLTIQGLAFAAFAQGGPPMMTDDPETPGSGKFEINIASIFQATGGKIYSQFPYADFNYGWGDHIQLKYETALNSVSSTSMPIGGTQAVAGIKWRFFDEESSGANVSIYPQYQFAPKYIPNAPTDPSTSFLFPIELNKKFGSFVFNPELGYSFQSDSASNYWVLKALIAYELNSEKEVMAELVDQIGKNSDHSQMFLNFGCRFKVDSIFTVLASYGTSLVTPADVPAMQFAYLGLQLHL